MSYYVVVKGRRKSSTKREALQQLGLMMLPQPEHTHDFPLVAEAVAKAIDVVEDGDINVTVSGSISTEWDRADGPERVRSVEVTIRVTSAPISAVPPLPELVEQSR